MKHIDDISVQESNWEESTEFTDPQELYKWLCDNEPQEELVFSHGDISNLMIQKDEIFFFDLARCGIWNLTTKR